MIIHNPYNYHVAVRDDKMFFGREDILKRIVDGLLSPTPLSAAIFGGRRCGKTSLLSKLARVLSREVGAAGERKLIPCTLDLQRGRHLNCSDDLFLWILEELGEAWELQHQLERGAVVEALQNCYRDAVPRGPVDAFVGAFRSLDKRGERIRLVILIDESEHIFAAQWGTNLRPNLRMLLSSSPIVEDVALVMAGSTRMYAKVSEHDSPLENILDRYLLSTLSVEATLALARHPNRGRLSEEAAEEVWHQSGGQPCIAQYILHDMWEEIDNATVQDVQIVAETFDDRTRHFSAWTTALGQEGNDLYHFLAEQDSPVRYPLIRQQFSQIGSIALQSSLDALLYHGLIHCHGQGKQRKYGIAGQAYRDWFLSAGRLETIKTETTSERTEKTQIVVHGDYVARDKPIGVDQRGQDVHSTQTNILGEVNGAVVSGDFEDTVTVENGK